MLCVLIFVKSTCDVDLQTGSALPFHLRRPCTVKTLGSSHTLPASLHQKVVIDLRLLPTKNTSFLGIRFNFDSNVIEGLIVN